MPPSKEELRSSHFQIARRTIVLFCASVLLIAVGFLDTDKFSNEEENLRLANVLNSTEREFVPNENSTSSGPSPELARTCGPAQLTGKTGLGSSFSKWLPWSQARTGTLCRKVRFRKAFTNPRDIRLFVSADRTASEGNGHLTPIVWAEKIGADGFQACVHFNSDYDQDADYWREKMIISWWALDSESPAEPQRRYLGRVLTSLERNNSVCLPLPEEVNPHSNSVLVSTSHPGISYEQYYSYQPSTTHTARESVISWINQRGNSTFDVCVKRLYEKTPGKIEDAGVDVVSFRRDKRYSGLAKIQLGDYGRGCVYVASDLTKVGSADDETTTLPMILVQARINRNDRGADGRSPQVTAWVEQKLARGFTVCAKNLARAVWPAKHTIQIHWIAVHDVPVGMDSSLCRDGVVAA